MKIRLSCRAACKMIFSSKLRVMFKNFSLGISIICLRLNFFTCLDFERKLSFCKRLLEYPFSLKLVSVMTYFKKTSIVGRFRENCGEGLIYPVDDQEKKKEYRR